MLFLILSLICVDIALKTDVAPKIDGILDSIWFKTTPIENFTQYWPMDGIPASESTKVYFLYDDKNLYFAFQCFDSEPEKIEAELTMRDEARGDGVGVLLSTFNDETSYWFSVNPLGVKTDAFLYGDGRYWDATWDGVWYADARIEPWGWSAEFKIPYKTLRFREGKEGWRINFLRRIARKGETDSWAPMRREEGLRISRFGWLMGVKPGHSLALEFYPVFFVRGEGYGEGTPLDKRGRFGFDCGWSLTPSIIIQTTFHPDFGEIEADPYRINLSRYELYLKERRPFFLERRDIFETPIPLFYSRRIGKRLPDGTEVPILFGGRITSLGAEHEAGFLFALTGESGNEEESAYFVTRARRKLLKGLKAGFIATGKNTKSESVSSGGIDISFMTRTISIVGQSVLSYKDSVGGYAHYFGFNLKRSHYHLHGVYRRFDEGLNISETGYMPLFGEELRGGIGPDFYPGGFIKHIAITLFLKRKREWDEEFPTKGGGISALFEMEGERGLYIRGRILRDYEMGRKFKTYDIYAAYWSGFTSSIEESLSVYYSNLIYNYNLRAFGPILRGRIFGGLKPSSRLHLSLEGNLWWESREDKKYSSTVFTLIPRVEFALNRDMLVRGYIEYNSKTHIHRGYFLYAYNFAPKSWFYIGFNLTGYYEGEIHFIDRIFILKIRYLLSI